jgi:hypothetical protein
VALALAERPIFVVGSERSGTTLLMAMIGCHPRIAVPEVAWYYPRFRPYLHTYGDLANEANFAVLVDEMAHGLKTPYWDMTVNPRTLTGELVASARERSFAGAYCATLDRYAAEINKPRWGEKTPYNQFFIKEILDDFPNAQFVYIVRDGRDASADYLESSFGPTNIFCAAEIWRMGQDAIKPWRARLPKDQWCDVKYEALVREPVAVLQRVCAFLGETYSDAMLEFHRTKIAQRRGKTKDHAPLGKPVSDQYIGIYKNILSLRDQRIFAWVAGAELKAAGYDLDVEPLALSDAEVAHWRDFDARFRAASLESTEGHIVYESYNDWLADQREERRRKGVWSQNPTPLPFPIGTPYEELLTGYRAWRKWKDHFCIKRQYCSSRVTL